jgi:hypothetical protein
MLAPGEDVAIVRDVRIVEATAHASWRHTKQYGLKEANCDSTLYRLNTRSESTHGLPLLFR